MTDFPFVVAYSNDELQKVVQKLSIPYNEETVDAFSPYRLHYSYFCEYFQNLDAKTIVVEKEYVDRDYLSDYIGYYATAFHQYKRFCARIHFFSSKFDETVYTAYIQNAGSNSGISDETYLGFMVIKPLAKTPIGRTCLKTYSDKASRMYGAVREYEVHLHGKTYHLQSLAYQQQDGVVAACATTALWSAFHGTSHLFKNRTPTPIEITRIACNGMPRDNRNLPSDGLTLEEMAHAIQEVGLEPEMFSVQSSDLSLPLFQLIVEAYTTFGIPIILGGVLYNRTTKEFLGFHAVCVTGYNKGKTCGKVSSIGGIHLRSAAIDKVYLHDDQVGPFARSEIRLVSDDEHAPHGLDEYDLKFDLTTSWGYQSREDINFAPLYALAPVYNKIRIRVDVLIESISKIEEDFASVYDNPIEWEIALYNSSNLKNELAKYLFSSDAKKRLLLRSMPKYIWVAKAYSDDAPCFLFLFDATDISAHCFSSVTFLDE